jgi:hypothetical protein
VKIVESDVYGHIAVEIVRSTNDLWKSGEVGLFRAEYITELDRDFVAFMKK